MDSRLVVPSASKRKVVTGNTTIAGGGTLVGVAVSASSAGTLTLSDDAGAIINAMPLTAGQSIALPCVWVGTLTITVGGTLNATLFYGD